MEVDEQALVAAARAGDADAFERLVLRHADAVYRIVAGHLGSDEAEDAAQEVFVRVHKGIASYKGESQLSTWIFRVATNVALTRSKQRRKRPRPGALDSAPEAAATTASPGEGLEQAETAEAVRRAVQELPEEQRAVAVLRGLEGLPFEEVARILGIKRPTAESRMNRAKEKLKQALSRWV